MPTWSAPISLKGVKGDSTPQTLPNDLIPNSVAIAPVSGDNAASALTQRNASGTTVFASDPSGNVTVAGTLNVAGAATLAAISGASLAVSGNETVGGNLSVTGTLTAGALTASGTNIAGDQTVQGNDTVNGTLKVTGATTLGALTASSINDTGMLNVSGGTTLAGLSATTGSFSGQLNATSVVVSGTLTPNGDVNVGGKLTVQKNVVVNGGTQTVGLLTASGGLSSPNNGISVVGGTTTDTLSCSGNGSIAGTVGLGTTTASALTTSGNARVNGNFTVTSGTSALGGPVNVTGAAALASTLNVTGATTMAGLTASSSSITGNETVGGTLAVTGVTTLGSVTASSASVTGATSLAGVTASGTVTAANVTLSTGGKITFADGSTQAQASAAAIDPSFNSVIVAPVSGNQTASSLKINNSGGTTLFSVDGSGNAVVGGTLKATGATTLAAVTASSASTTGNASVGGTLSVTGTSTLAAANATNVTASGTLNVTGTTTLGALNASTPTFGTLSVSGQSNLGTVNAVNSTATVKNLTLTSGGAGQLTFADGTTQTTAAAGATATNSRSVLYIGGNAHSNQPANSLWTYELTQTDEGSTNSASTRPNPGQMKLPFPFTVTGWALQQYRATGTQQFQLVKNRSSSALGSLVTVNAGNATVAGFPGNAFSGTFTKGTYNFTAADTIGAVGQNSIAGQNDVQLWLTIEWT